MRHFHGHSLFVELPSIIKVLHITSAPALIDGVGNEQVRKFQFRSVSNVALFAETNETSISQSHY